MFLYLSNNIYRKAVFMFNLLISDVYQHEFETFFHLLCFDHHGKIQKKMFTHADSDIFQDLYILSTFLNSVYANCLWYSFKIHSSFDDKHVNVYKVVHVLAFFLGKYQSASVISSLKDLLRNEDSNIRAVAAVSLAKTGNQDKSTINVLLKCLNDKDRLVRESGCLALGHIKAKRAVPKLLHLW